VDSGHLNGRVTAIDTGCSLETPSIVGSALQTGARCHSNKTPATAAQAVITAHTLRGCQRMAASNRKQLTDPFLHDSQSQTIGIIRQ